MSRTSKAKRGAVHAIEALYASLPTIQCQGLCYATCSINTDLLVELELERLTDRLGRDPGIKNPADRKVGDDLRNDCADCPLLAHERCTHYDLRPLMCRLWGVVDDPLMICPHGCLVSPRYLSNAEVRALWERLGEINRRYLDS